MATFPLIFPSLSRMPSMDSSKTIEDDTIRDPAESGYVSTRPRFTRTRDTWKVNVRNLTAEDKRALDYFVKVSAARGSNSFLYPNLVPNGSFEFSPVDASELVLGWSVAGDTAAQEAVAVTLSPVGDGSQAIQISTVATQVVAAGALIAAQLNCDQPINCTPGEVYVFTAALNATQGTLAAGVLGAAAVISFNDGFGNVLSTQTVAASIVAGWRSYGLQFTIPAGTANFTIQLNATLTNSSGIAFTLDGSASVTWDAAGCGLVTPVQWYGRMVGSDPLPRPVRFTKIPEFSDIGWANGQKVYGVNFELTEV